MDHFGLDSICCRNVTFLSQAHFESFQALPLTYTARSTLAMWGNWKMSSGRSISVKAIIDFLPMPDFVRICQRWKGLEQWALSIPFWQSSSLGICVCQCRRHKPKVCAQGQPDPDSTQNLICTLNIVHGMDVPCVSTLCLYWVISAIGNSSVLNTH